ncbi:MAG: hypothetical protein CME21_21450 [Gemmatimonadetes bacterium]|nr:hypothetical protein [Gemmatimonadota bacterium]
MPTKKDLDKARREKEIADGLVRLSRQATSTKELRASVRALTRELDETRRDLAIAIGSSGLKPIKIKKRKSARGSVVPVLLFSDWHIEEIVPADQTDGLNEYNLDIAKLRMERLLENSAKMISSEIEKSKVSEAVVWLGGDFLSGYIHDELIETTLMPPLRTAEVVYEWLMGALKFIADQTKVERVLIPTSYGNHGRITTGKPRYATAPYHNVEQMVYRSMSRDLSDDDRFVFDVRDTRVKILDIDGFKLRVHHGDDLRYQGGTGGFHAPLVNLIRRWDQMTPAHFTVMGHYHTMTPLRFACINGSLIGPSEYSRRFGSERPTQTFLVLDKERNELAGVSPIWVE